jgi:hypothetical protein
MKATVNINIDSAVKRLNIQELELLEELLEKIGRGEQQNQRSGAAIPAVAYQPIN